MKKIYFLLTAAAVALTASAADLQLKTPVGRKVNKPVFAATAVADNMPFAPSASVKADDAYTLEGSYTVTIGDYYFQSSANGAIEEVASITLDGDIATISCSYWNPMKVTAKYDEATQTLLFEEGDFFEVPLQSGATYYSKMVPYKYNTEATSFADAFIYTSFTATFDPATGTITVGDGDDYGLMFAAYESDDELGETGSYFSIFDLVGFTPYVEPSGELDLTEWEDFSTATLIDGWILPAAGVDPAEYPINLNAMRNKENPNLIALIDPYVGVMNGATSGAIVFDIQDPEFVAVLPGVYSGFTNGTAGKLCCLNVEGYWLYRGYTKEEIQENLSESYPEWSSYTEEDGKTVITIPNARFNYLTSPNNILNWTNLADKMKSTITIDALVGVESVIVDQANEAVEYYNLQGIRVVEPSNGLYIVRQGSKATKQVVK